MGIKQSSLINIDEGQYCLKVGLFVS